MSMEIDEDLEGFNEYARELMKKLPLEDRLADLAPEEALLALPDAALAALDASYVDTLAEPLRSAVRARRGS